MAKVIPLKGRDTGADAIGLSEREAGDTIAATWLDLSVVGGASDFVSLTDTPAHYSGASKQFVRVNTAGDALEYHDLLGAANEWTAKQTFGATAETWTALSGTTPSITAGSHTWTLTGASTPTDGLSDGDHCTLMIDDGSASTIDWSSVVDVWIPGAAPALRTTGYTPVVLWKIGTTVYGSHSE